MSVLHMTARARTSACVVLGVAVGAAVWVRGPWELAVMGGWVACAGGQVGLIWPAAGRADAAGTAEYARVDDDSRAVTRGVVLVACVVSLVAVVAGMHRAGLVSGWDAALLRAGAVLTIVLSWALVHSLYSLHYADLYYSADPPGGIDFPHPGDRGDAPDFRDFAYVAFGVGMTYQVADTDITSRVVRRVVLCQALLSYLFGAAIIAATINVVAGLI